MEQHSEGLDLQRALAALRRRGWIVLACVVVCASAAFALAKRETKRYSSTASIAFTSNPLNQQIAGLTSTGGANGNLLAQQANDVELVRLGDTATKTAAALGNGLTGEKVASSISVAPAGESGIVTVTASAGSAAQASAIANTYVQLFVKEDVTARKADLATALRSVNKQLAALTLRQRTGADGLALQNRAQTLRLLGELGSGDVSVAGEAPTPTAAVSPRPSRNAVLGGALGLLIGLALVFALDRLDTRLRSVEDLELAYGAPVLGAVTKVGKDTDPSTVDSEDFALIRAQLHSLPGARPARTVLVCSAESGEGKSTVAAGLARAAASAGVRALLLECDLRKPSMAERFGLTSSEGLSDVLAGTVNASSAVREIGSGGTLDVLPAGTATTNPVALLEGDAMRLLLAWATGSYELIVLDAPALSVPDVFTLARQVDGVLAVAWLGRSRRDAAGAVRRVLARTGAPLLGVVANGAGARAARYASGSSAVETGRPSQPQTAGIESRPARPVPGAADALVKS